MRTKILVLSLAGLALAACQEAEAPGAGLKGPGGHKARYVGVGLYFAGELWSELVQTAAPADPAAPTLDDDGEIIVLLDSVTGELRQCGNLSGHCIAMNPWADAGDPAKAAPARLLKHARQLREEAQAKETQQRPARVRVQAD